MICSNCGTENDAGRKFCGECASPLATPCPNCGTPNPPTVKFCGECATPLGTATAPAAATPLVLGPPLLPADSPVERRLVSVLFADLVGFTPYSEAHDAEDVRETLDRYFEIARNAIERHGGMIEKFIGDAVMAVWGAPTAREDDAERAVRAGLELVDAVVPLGVEARAGVLTGEAAVNVGAVGEGMVVGDIVNTASRLQGAAAPGTVLVGEATYRAASEAIAFEPAGEQSLKGKAAPVPAWRALRIVAERGGRNRTEGLEAPFVGRAEELRLLKDLFHATDRERRIRLVSVMGPAGIGKSRLASEFLKYLDGLVDPVFWHEGRSPAYGEGITFWALGEMVRGRAGLLESDDETTTRAKIADVLERFVPDVSDRRWIEPALLTLLGIASGIGSEELFAAWRMFFERLAAQAAVVMVFADLHFADPGLLDFVDHLQEWSKGVPIYVVTLARPELLEKRPDWGAGKRSFVSLALERLPDAAMRELIGGLVPGLPEPTTRSIVARADGIPLYAVETVRMLVAEGKLALTDGAYRPTGDLATLAVPETLTTLITSRLDALEAADRLLIADAAVLGQSFTPAALLAVAGPTEADLEPRLRGLVRREFLRLEADPRSPERGQYAFVQALIREVAYNTLSKKARKVRHLAAARYFESLGTDELAGGLAGHYLAAHRLAGDGPEADALAAQARVALRGAAERAAALGSHEQALTFVEQALQVTADIADRAELHERALASALQGLSEAAVMRHAEGALAVRRELADRPAIAMAVAAHARAVRTFRGEPDRALELLLPAWEEFADLEETPAGVALMGAIQSAYAGLDRTVEHLAWLDRLLPIAERLDLFDELVSGLLARGMALSNSGRPREGLLILRGAHGLALANGLRDRERGGRQLLTFQEQWSEPVAGLELAREGLEIARQIGSSLYGFTMVGNGVVCALRVGEWDWAAALLGEWIPDDATARYYAEFHVDRAILAALRGGDASADIDRAATLRSGITDPQFESYETWARAWAAFSAGRFAEARTQGLRAAETTSYFHPLAAPLAARASLWAGDVEGARTAMAALDRTMFRGQALAQDKAAIGAGILALEGRTADALALYRETLRGWRGLKLAWDEALTCLDMVTFLGPAEPEVRAGADVARVTLSRLGAQPYLERLEAALTRDGVRTPAMLRRTKRTSDAEIPAVGGDH